MVAQEILLSTKPFHTHWSARETYEPPLAGLQHDADQGVTRKIELGGGLVPHPDAALPDEPPRLTRRQAEGVRDDRREMHRIACRKRNRKSGSTCFLISRRRSRFAP